MAQLSIGSRDDRFFGLSKSIAQIALLAMLPLGIGALMLAAPEGQRAPAAPTAAGMGDIAVRSRDVVFSEGADGVARVIDITDGTAVLTMAAGDGGFVRTALRLLVLERRRLNSPVDAAFRITRWSSDRVTIEDLGMGKTLALNAYGPTNAGAFAQLLETRRTQP